MENKLQDRRRRAEMAADLLNFKTTLERAARDVHCVPVPPRVLGLQGQIDRVS